MLVLGVSIYFAKKSFFYFWSAKNRFLVKNLPNIGCKMAPLHFFKTIRPYFMYNRPKFCMSNACDPLTKKIKVSLIQ